MAVQSIIKDDHDVPYTLEWMVTDILSADLAAFKKSICSLASLVTAAEETKFLQAFPEAVSDELFLQSCTPFFEEKNAPINWEAVEGQIRSTIQQFYEVDLSKFGPAVIKPLLNDIYFCLTLKAHESSEIVGFLMAAITPQLPEGYVKLIHMVLSPSLQKRGLEIALLNTVVERVEGIKQLFCFVRPTNTSALETYTNYGFRKAPDLLEDPHHKVNRQYLVPLLKAI